MDLFRVEGGETHDWIVNHAGTSPALSLETAESTFVPEAWLANGSGKTQTATSSDTWTAQWPVNGVTSRLTMLGATESRVFALETYPLNNAVITDAHLPTQTLCVRRTQHAPFVAVWDAWKEQPNLREVTVAPNRPDAMTVSTTAHTYHIAFGPGPATFADGTRIDTDAAFVLLRDRSALTLVHGTQLKVAGAEEMATVMLDAPATVQVHWNGRNPAIAVSGAIAHDTRGGQDHPRAAPIVAPSITGNWFQMAP